MIKTIHLSTFMLLAIVLHARAGITEFSDKSAWESSVGGNFQSITFIEFLDFEFPVQPQDFYEQSHGVVFEDDDTTFGGGGFLNDTVGLTGGAIISPAIRISFLQPQLWIGVDHPGTVIFDLYFEGELIASDVGLNLPGSGIGLFSGLISTIPFDEAVLRDFDEVFIDDLHFGVPAPGALPLLGLAALLGRSRRRGT